MESGEEVVLRPMNCPHHIQIYMSKTRSYRDLPIRIAELGTMYRLERSGELAGLARVRARTLNDAHIFGTPEQMLGEFIRVVQLIQEVYAVLGFKDYNYRLSLGDPNDKVKFEDNEAMWQRSEAALREALDQLGVAYYESVGDAAFYGPKLDVQVANVLGKDETISTVQLDFTLPERFQLEYIGEDGMPHRPVMIHRGVLSTMERIMAFLIENYAGNFPVWLAPVQAVVIPISDERHSGYAERAAQALRAARLRVEGDLRKERMNAKVRDAQLSAQRFTSGGGAGVVLRFAGFYGPDSPQTRQLISFVRHSWAPIPGAPERFFSSVTHDDAATAVVAALGLPAGVYNVADDEPLRRRELFDSLPAPLGVAPPRLPPTWMTPP